MDFENQDDHRRNIVYSSILGKINSAEMMIAAAKQAASKGQLAQSNDDSIEAKKNAEAVFAAAEEAIQSLKMVRMLTVKVGSNRSIPPMGKFLNALNDYSATGSFSASDDVKKQ